MTQYLRYCQITIGGSTYMCTDTGNPPVQGLRGRFQFTSKPTQMPATCQIMITNPPRQQAESSVKKALKVSIDAGYQDGHSIIYEGESTQVIYGRESPTDTLLTVYAASLEQAHNHAIVKTTLPPGSTPKDHLNVAMQAMQPFGATLGFIDAAIDLTIPKYPRAVTLWGMARDVLSNIAKTKGALVSYQKSEVTMTLPTSKKGGPVILNSQTGMIGMPSRTTEGIMVRCLINPAIHFAGQVHIDQKDIQESFSAIAETGTLNPNQQLAMLSPDGIYLVYFIETTGDTRGNPWYQDLRCYAPGETSPSVSGAASNLGLVVN